MLERLSGDYNRGYTAALTDFQRILKYIEPDLKHHKKPANIKTMMALVNCCINNREKLREHRDGFIRYNGQLKDFEWFSGNDD